MTVPQSLPAQDPFELHAADALAICKPEQAAVVIRIDTRERIR